MNKEDLKQYKIYSQLAKELTGVEAELYVFTFQQLQELVKNNAILNVSNSTSGIIEIDTKIQLLPRKWYQLYKRGWQTHTDFFGRRYFIRYHWTK